MGVFFGKDYLECFHDVMKILFHHVLETFEIVFPEEYAYHQFYIQKRNREDREGKGRKVEGQ